MSKPIEMASIDDLHSGPDCGGEWQAHMEFAGLEILRCASHFVKESDGKIPFDVAIRSALKTFVHGFTERIIDAEKEAKVANEH